MIQYDKWVGISNTSASGGSYRQNGTKGADAKLVFNGTRIDWLTAKGPTFGQVNVFLDGRRPGTTIDLYAPTPQWQVTYTFSAATAGQHTLEIKPTGTKNIKSKGTFVVVDAFRGQMTLVGVPIPAGPGRAASGEPAWLWLLPIGVIGLWPGM